MESYKFEITKEQMQKSITYHLEKELEGGYSSNPIREAVKNAISENKEGIQKLVSDILTESIKDPEFKEKLANVALSRIIEKGLK